MIKRRFNTPATSSVGRLFDAVASIAGLRQRMTFEGQAAMELEGAADSCGAEELFRPAYPFAFLAARDSLDVVDTRPIMRGIVRDRLQRVPSEEIARRFHDTLSAVVTAACERIRAACGVNEVVLSGGAFVNKLLTEGTIARLAKQDFRVYRHRLVPPNDGGLCLGQLAIGAARISADQAASTETEAGAELTRNLSTVCGR